MSVTEIIFTREGIDGLAPVGSRLSDIMSRFGIRLDGNCLSTANDHVCLVTVTRGESALSPLSKLEEEHFSKHKRNPGERLACQVMVAKAGEITIMTAEKEKKSKERPDEDKMFAAFSELPLDEKLSKLVKMEAATLSETISFVLDSPFKVFEKIGDLMADIGMKKDAESKSGNVSGKDVPTPPKAEDTESEVKKPNRTTRTKAATKQKKERDQQ